MKLYMVTAEGYFHGYGSYTYLLGIFDTIEAVEKVKENYRKTVLKQIEKEYKEVKQNDAMADVSFYDYVNRYYEFVNDFDSYVEVKEITVNKEFPMESSYNDPRDYVNNMFLGGYID